MPSGYQQGFLPDSLPCHETVKVLPVKEELQRQGIAQIGRARLPLTSAAIQRQSPQAPTIPAC